VENNKGKFKERRGVTLLSLCYDRKKRGMSKEKMHGKGNRKKKSHEMGKKKRLNLMPLQVHISDVRLTNLSPRRRKIKGGADLINRDVLRGGKGEKAQEGVGVQGGRPDRAERIGWEGMLVLLTLKRSPGKLIKLIFCSGKLGKKKNLSTLQGARHLLS